MPAASRHSCHKKRPHASTTGQATTIQVTMSVMKTVMKTQTFGGAAKGSRQMQAVQCSCNNAHSSRPERIQPSLSNLDRRSTLLQLATAIPAAASLLVPGPAAAQNGFVTWWKSRRSANGGAKLLAPLYVAQRRLQEASDLLKQSSSLGSDDVTAALQLVRSSSLNCYIFEALPDDTIETKASLLTQKWELSVSHVGRTASTSSSERLASA